MKKKILALCLVVVLAATAIVGGTLAYFTDDDAATNTFTIGSIEIDLLESKYHRGNPAAMPGIYQEGVTEVTDEMIKEDDAVYQDYLATEGKNIMPGGDWVSKNAYVENTGANDAYVRLNIYFPNDGKFIQYSETSTALEQGWVKAASKTVDGADVPGGIAGVSYLLWTYTYTEELAPGDLTEWSPIGGVRLASRMTSADVAETQEALTEGQQAASFGIIVTADAIQSEGFADYAAAFAAFDAQ